LPTETSK
jgi:hypothetical protein